MWICFICDSIWSFTFWYCLDTVVNFSPSDPIETFIRVSPHKCYLWCLPPHWTQPWQSSALRIGIGIGRGRCMERLRLRINNAALDKTVCEKGRQRKNNNWNEKRNELQLQRQQLQAADCKLQTADANARFHNIEASQQRRIWQREHLHLHLQRNPQLLLVANWLGGKWIKATSTPSSGISCKRRATKTNHQGLNHPQDDETGKDITD